MQWTKLGCSLCPEQFGSVVERDMSKACWVTIVFGMFCCLMSWF
jgi:hypothetical protein